MPEQTKTDAQSSLPPAPSPQPPVASAARARRLRLGMIGGGRGAFIGAVHRMAARLDDRYELVAGVLSSDPQRSRESGADLLLEPGRCYPTIDEMLRAECARADRIDVVAIVTPNHLHHAAARQFPRRRLSCDLRQTAHDHGRGRRGSARGGRARATHSRGDVQLQRLSAGAARKGDDRGRRVRARYASCRSSMRRTG